MDIKHFHETLKNFTQIYLFTHAAAYEGIKWTADSLTFPGSLQAMFAINTCVFKHNYKYIHIGCYNLIQ